MVGHEDGSATGWLWALLSKTVDNTSLINTVELEDGKLDWFALVLDDLGGGVGLLLSLLSHTTSKTEDKMESGLFLDIVVGKSTAIF